MPNLELRDGFFTRLKARCEAMVATNVKENGEKRKIALLAHSWGDSVARAFFLWADHKVRESGKRKRKEKEKREREDEGDFKTKKHTNNDKKKLAAQ